MMDVTELTVSLIMWILAGIGSLFTIAFGWLWANHNRGTKLKDEAIDAAKEYTDQIAGNLEEKNKEVNKQLENVASSLKEVSQKMDEVKSESKSTCNLISYILLSNTKSKEIDKELLLENIKKNNSGMDMNLVRQLTNNDE